MVKTSVVGRARSSPWPAIEITEADLKLDTIRKQFPRLTKKHHLAHLVLGRIVAEEFRAPENVPKMRTSAKDGYAVIASDGDGHRRVVGSSTAGSPFTKKVNRGECVRVSTGAVIPNGADAVIQVEDSDLISYSKDIELEVNFKKIPTVGQDIRQPGSDMELNQLLIGVGCELGSAEIGILASFGIQSIDVFKTPKVCILSTGNELCESYVQSSAIPPGYIRDSNRPQLMALFKSQGFKPIDGGIVADQYSSIESGIITASRVASVIVTTGGVSMGEKDCLKEVLGKSLGLKIEFGRVLMKPGLPCTFAHGEIEGRKVAVFALPGNPVSAWVCAQLFVSPFLRGIGGHAQPKPTFISVMAGHPIKLGDRPEFCRAYIKTEKNASLPVAYVTGKQTSSTLTSLVGAKVLLVIPTKTEKTDELKKNEILEAIVISSI